MVKRQPVRSGADTLYAEYVMTTDGARHERVVLGGDVTCFGGPALDGNVPVEVYVRRAVSAEQIVEDTVAIFPDDLVPRRQIFSMTPGEGATELREGAVVRGRALLTDPTGAETVKLFTLRDGGIVLVVHHASSTGMRLAAHRLDPAVARDGGLSIDALETTVDWSRLQGTILQIAAASTVMSYKGELPAIPSAECGEMFSHFPRPQRRTD